MATSTDGSCKARANQQRHTKRMDRIRQTSSPRVYSVFHQSTRQRGGVAHLGCHAAWRHGLGLEWRIVDWWRSSGLPSDTRLELDFLGAIRSSGGLTVTPLLLSLQDYGKKKKQQQQQEE